MFVPHFWIHSCRYREETLQLLLLPDTHYQTHVMYDPGCTLATEPTKEDRATDVRRGALPSPTCLAHARMH